MKWSDVSDLSPAQQAALVCLSCGCSEWRRGCTDAPGACDWWAEMARHSAIHDANATYVNHLCRLQAVPPRAVPVDDDAVASARALGLALVALTLLTAGMVFWMGGRWLGVL